ncbi:MAG: helix-turn-helix transcriptional regulator [Clostridia bacterium]|nr:helix-turn-helix transcriptional regulator [Clostridia bacterium]
MLKQLQYIGEHIRAVTGVSYAVFQTDADLPEACIIPSCSICQNCPLETRIYAHTHSHGIEDAKRNGGKQIYDCRMGFTFCALIAKSDEGEEYALVLGPIVSGELHDGLYQSFSPELDRAVSRVKPMSALQIRNLLEMAEMILRAALPASQKPFELGSIPDGESYTKQIKEKYSSYLSGRDGFVLSRIEHLRTLMDDGDQKGMEKSITELINRLYIENRGELDVFKARSVQLIDMFGRMIIDRGQEASGILSEISGLLRHLDTLDDADTLCIWLKDTMVHMSVMALQKYHIVYHDVVSKTIQFLRANWDKKITLDEIVSATHVSKAYLCTIFKKQMGMSILEYLTRLRVEKAKEMLSASNITLMEIAQQCCFFDQSYFSKVFRKYSGYTPKQWREFASGMPAAHE